MGHGVWGMKAGGAGEQGSRGAVSFSPLPLCPSAPLPLVPHAQCPMPHAPCPTLDCYVFVVQK
jgi:hypothetical protein